jgi:hypothetical protein
VEGAYFARFQQRTERRLQCGGVEVAYVDQGHTGEAAATAAQAQGIELAVVKLPEAKRGFVLLPRRPGSSNATLPGRRASGGWRGIMNASQQR